MLMHKGDRNRKPREGINAVFALYCLFSASPWLPLTKPALHSHPTWTLVFAADSKTNSPLISPPQASAYKEKPK